MLLLLLFRSCTMYSCFSKEKLCLTSHFHRIHNKLTLPYLRALFLVWLHVIVKGNETETEIVWKEKTPTPPPLHLPPQTYLYRAGYVQASQNALQVLIN